MNSRLGNGGGVLDGGVDGTVTEGGRLDGQNGHAGGRRTLATVGLEYWAVGGVPGVTCGSGDRRGQGNGHEAETLSLKVLHGGAHVFFHQLRNLVFSHHQGVVRRRRLVALGPTIAATSLNTVTATLQQQPPQQQHHRHTHFL